MASYLDLPNDLLAHVVTDWLVWKAVGQLDSAMCSKNNRNRWLELLKSDCIFRCVNVGYPPRNYGWCISRQVKTCGLSFFIESVLACNQEAAVSWLRNTAQMINTMHISSSSGATMSAVLHVCCHLRKLRVGSCVIDNTFWELVRINPNLEELHILEYCDKFNFVGPVPADLPMFHLKRLELHLGLTSPSDVIPLFQKLPILECLRLVQEDNNILKIYDCLPDSCPKLVSLDLECAQHYESDNERFCMLMSSLKSWLRCLVLPFVQRFTIRELQSISHYHSHSLRCLVITGFSFLDGDLCAYNYTDLINSLPYLHTLHISVWIIDSLASKKITNTTITHLMVDFGNSSIVILCELAEHCPAATMLSINHIQRRSSVVRDVSNLLQLRPLIQTICVDKYEVKLQLREALSNITVCKGTGEIDIFEQEY